MKMISIQKINVPEDCNIITNEFYNYDPKKAFTEADNYRYLREDLFQCTFPEESLIIDLGWYGDLKTNTGEFKIDIIKSENWEIPMHTIYSASVLEIKELLVKIIDYYSGIAEEEEEEEEASN
ncbi:MAG: hypothetical protein COB98_10130 [Flavobacteriaceae bacterium]|nr:MAG: hypothetical protein COB98_10130 [Flavobacteriaceae bacterium]